MTSRRTWLGRLANLALAAVSLLVGLVLAEAAVRVFHLWPDQRGVLQRPMTGEVSLGGADAAAEQTADAAREAAASKFVVHPLVGWALRPMPWDDLWPGPPAAGDARQWLRRNIQVNAFGFHSSVRDYRLLSPDDFVVAIFGGSVAQNLAMRGGGELVRRLETRRPELAGSIWVLNLALGGYKQPQQLILLDELTLLGVPVDVVVNLDGFNEVALGAEDAAQGHHPLFPSRGSLAVVYDWNARRPSVAEIELVAEMHRLRREEAALRGWADQGWHNHVRLVRAWAGWRVSKLEQRRLEIERELRQSAEKDAAFFDLADPCLGRPGACWQLLGDLWERASLAMAHHAAGWGWHYLHLLQPNQYVAGSKTLSPEEIACCYAPDAPWSRSATEGFPHLRERGRRLQTAGVDFHDLTLVFADRKERVYEDTCCHLDDHGNELLGAEVGDLIADAIERRAAAAR